MTGPRLSVPCPRCGADAPAGLPRDVTLLALVGRPLRATELDVDDPSHVASQCPAGHPVHVYYRRTFTRPPDGSP